jgi:hypothetical protein
MSAPEPYLYLYLYFMIGQVDYKKNNMRTDKMRGKMRQGNKMAARIGR